MQKLKMFNFNCIFCFITIINLYCIQFIGQTLASSDNNNNNDIIRFKSASPRIIGGVNTQPGKYQFIVSIRNHKGNHTCGGFILKSNFIVTAAHCLNYKEINEFQVNAGSHLLHPGGVSHKIESVKSHSNYSYKDIQNDIGLIKLQSDIEFNNLTKPIEMGLDELQTGSDLTLIGWGLTQISILGITNRLQEITLKTIPLDECANAMKRLKPITDKQFCTFTQFGQGACFGDSGGPIIKNDKVYGIVSWGYPCGRGFPDVFTKLSAFNDWIAETMASM